MTKEEYDKKYRKLYNLRRTHAITYTEYEKRMAELEEAYANGTDHKLTVTPSAAAWNGLR